MTCASHDIQGAGRRRIFYYNLLPAIAKCAHCLGKMNLHIIVKKGQAVNRRTGVDSKPRYVAGCNIMYLACGNAHPRAQADRGHSPKCTNRSRVRYERLEPVILDCVLPLALKIPDLATSARISQLREAISEADDLLKLKRARLVGMRKCRPPTNDLSILQLARYIEYDEHALASLNRELNHASSQTRPAERQAHLHDVRVALNDPDHEIRILERKRIIQALGQVINIVLCDRDRVSTVVLDGGRVAIKIDGSGNVLERADATGTPELMTMLSREVDDNDLSLAAVMRRLAILQG